MSPLKPSALIGAVAVLTVIAVPAGTVTSMSTLASSEFGACCGRASSRSMRRLSGVPVLVNFHFVGMKCIGHQHLMPGSRFQGYRTVIVNNIDAAIGRDVEPCFFVVCLGLGLSFGCLKQESATVKTNAPSTAILRATAARSQRRGIRDSVMAGIPSPFLLR